MILSRHDSVGHACPGAPLKRNVTGRGPLLRNVTVPDIKNHLRLIPVNIGCGGLKTHKKPVSIGLWRVCPDPTRAFPARGPDIAPHSFSRRGCHVAASVAGPTSKIPNVYAACGAVAGPEGGNNRSDRKKLPLARIRTGACGNRGGCRRSATLKANLRRK